MPSDASFKKIRFVKQNSIKKNFIQLAFNTLISKSLVFRCFQFKSTKKVHKIKSREVSTLKFWLPVSVISIENLL